MVYRFIIQKRGVELLHLVRLGSLKEMIKKSGHTPRHISIVTDQWASEGLLVKKRKGREADLEITEKGEQLIKLLTQIDNLLKEIKSQED